MNRLMKLIIRFDKSKEQELYREELEPRKPPKALVKIVVTTENPEGMEETKEIPASELGFQEMRPHLQEAIDELKKKKKKKKHHSKKAARENMQSRRDGQLSAAACFSKARELFTDVIIKEKKQIPEAGQYAIKTEELFPKLGRSIKLE